MLIENKNFLLEEIPNYHPLSRDRKEFWKSQKRRIVEGYWVGGKWMPGQVYLYVNFWTILLNKSPNSKAKIASRPFLRDLEWEKGYLLTEARGFSGFSEDKKYTSNELYKPEFIKESINLGLINPNNLKEYVPAREYLRRNHGTNLGKPLFENQAKNIIDIEARGGGKSYFGSCCIGHNFITDGATDYDDYLLKLKEDQRYSSETLVGAIDAKYSKDLLSKFKFGYDEMPGSIEHNGVMYPSPLYKNYKGSLEPSKYWEAVSQVKVGNNWIERGSRSKIHHRTFADNPFAANGTRPGLSFIDEIGFMGNLIHSLGALKECTADGANKFGTIWMFGTGGDMSGGATLAAKAVFDDPEAYDCLAFPDEYEGRANKIGYFVPATKTLNQYKNSEGVSDMHKAEEFLLSQRDKAKKSRRVENINNELQNRPLVPSEAFLAIGGNTFPVAELKDRLSEIEGNPEKHIDSNWVGILSYREALDSYELEPKDDIFPIRDFPLKDNKNADGAIEIFEKPQRNANGTVLRGVYIAGIDPYDDDFSSTDSLGSIFIYNRLTRRIVAEYTGRPGNSAKDFYEHCRKLLMYYNAIALYESDKKGIFAHFEQHKCLYLLAETPSQLRDTETFREGSNKSRGVNGTTKVNNWARELIKAWLKETLASNANLYNLHRIKSVGLLKELITWNPDANFDRVSALGMCMILDETMYKEVEQTTKQRAETFLNNSYWRDLGVLRN